eukprot:Nk52_evm17s359 gene=Nk52_evmTU17s359
MTNRGGIMHIKFCLIVILHLLARSAYTAEDFEARGEKLVVNGNMLGQEGGSNRLVADNTGKPPAQTADTAASNKPGQKEERVRAPVSEENDEEAALRRESIIDEVAQIMEGATGTEDSMNMGGLEEDGEGVFSLDLNEGDEYDEYDEDDIFVDSLRTNAGIGTLRSEAELGDDLLGFEEWKKSILEEQQVEVSAQEKPPAEKQKYQFKKRKRPPASNVNYASFDCGAKVREHNPKVKGASNILNDNRDQYMLSPCNINRFFIVELCEEVMVSRIEMANYEFFSSTFKEVKVFASVKYPSKSWMLISHFSAENIAELQKFNASPNTQYAKFLRVEIVSHHDDEFYCPVSIFKVFGVTMLDEFKYFMEHDSHNHNEEEIAQTSSEQGDGVQNDVTESHQRDSGSGDLGAGVHGDDPLKSMPGDDNDKQPSEEVTGEEKKGVIDEAVNFAKKLLDKATKITGSDNIEEQDSSGEHVGQDKENVAVQEDLVTIIDDEDESDGDGEEEEKEENGNSETGDGSLDASSDNSTSDDSSGREQSDKVSESDSSSTNAIGNKDQSKLASADSQGSSKLEPVEEQVGLMKSENSASDGDEKVDDSKITERKEKPEGESSASNGGPKADKEEEEDANKVKPDDEERGDAETPNTDKSNVEHHVEGSEKREGENQEATVKESTEGQGSVVGESNEGKPKESSAEENGPSEIVDSQETQNGEDDDDEEEIFKNETPPRVPIISGNAQQSIFSYLSKQIEELKVNSTLSALYLEQLSNRYTQSIPNINRLIEEKFMRLTGELDLKESKLKRQRQMIIAQVYAMAESKMEKIALDLANDVASIHEEFTNREWWMRMEMVIFSCLSALISIFIVSFHLKGEYILAADSENRRRSSIHAIKAANEYLKSSISIAPRTASKNGGSFSFSIPKDKRAKDLKSISIERLENIDEFSLSSEDSVSASNASNKENAASEDCIDDLREREEAFPHENVEDIDASPSTSLKELDSVKLGGNSNNIERSGPSAVQTNRLTKKKRHGEVRHRKNKSGSKR